MSRTCEIKDCGRPYFGRGYCNKHYYHLVRKPKRELRMAVCAWCQEKKPLSEMRPKGASRGKTPSECQACRDNNPDHAWCDFHEKPHPKSEFTLRPERPIGVNPECKQAAVIKASRKRGHDPIKCASCHTFKESWEFRGGREKCPNCRDCEKAHPERHWCIDCADWLPRTMFTRTGEGGKYMTVRCKPCRTAWNHGVTVKQVLEAQGATSPECAACGSRDFLKVDHDHNCCPSAQGCPKCVRGYLCHSCNTSEGLLETAERAEMLAAYMRKVGQVASQVNQKV
jgi:hypothetical protein